MAAYEQNPKAATGYPMAHPSNTAYASTAYPYPARPYYPNPNPYPTPPPYAPPPNNRRSTLLRRLFIGVIAGTVVVGVILFIVWLVLRPRLPEFSVSSVSISGLNLTSNQLSADFDFALSVRNPNEKLSANYDQFAVSVLYGYDILARTTLPPLSQPKGNSTTLRGRLSAVGGYVDADAYRGLSDDLAKGIVEFKLQLFSWARFRSGVWRTRRHFMRVWCGDVDVRLSKAGNGTLSGGPRDCDVDL